MPAAARAQLFCRGDGRRRVRSQAGVGDGLRGHFRRVQTGLGKARSLLSQRNSRAGKSHEREHRHLDLAEAKTAIAVAEGNRRRGDLHSAVCLSRQLIDGSGRFPTSTGRISAAFSLDSNSRAVNVARAMKTFPRIAVALLLGLNMFSAWSQPLVVSRSGNPLLTIYAEFSGKTVLRSEALRDLPTLQELDIADASVDREKALERIESALRERKIDVIHDGEKFVWIVPAGLSNSPAIKQVERIRGSLPASSGSDSKSVAAGGTIDFRNMHLPPVFAVLSELSGRNVLKPTPLPPVSLTLTSRKSLTRDEVIYAIRMTLLFNGIAVIEDGERFFQAVPLRDAEKVKSGAPARGEDPLLDAAELTAFSAPAAKPGNPSPPRAATAGALVENYAKLTGRGAIVPERFDRQPTQLIITLPVTRSELLYAIEKTLELNGLQIRFNETGAVELSQLEKN